MTKKMNYTSADSTQTLGDGLNEYMEAFSHILIDNSHDDEKSQLFLKHDYTHVLFGTLPFELRGETLTDIWTLYGTDVGFKGYIRFLKYVDYKIIMNIYYKRYGSKTKAYWALFKLLPTVFKLLYRTRKMTSKWPFHNPQQFHDVPLNELRKDFNIKIVDAYPDKKV